MTRYVVGWRKVLLYARIAVHVAAYYLVRPSLFRYNPVRFVRFLVRALRLLLIFRHNKPVRLGRWVKLHLYLPAYPGTAFFRSIETKLLRRPPGAVTVVFSMTRACRYHCPHCYQRRDKGKDLDEALLLRTARDIRDAGTTLFDIEGGEPFQRSDRLLALVRELGDGVETWVNTTGDGLDSELLRELRNAGCYGLMVSIHSPDSSRHDAFTGVPGSFDLACDTLRLARKQRLAAAVNSVLSEDELRQGRLTDLMDLARSMDCDFVQLIHPKPAGLWLEQREGMQSDPALIDRVRQDHLLYNSARCAEYPSLAAQVFEEAPFVLGCTAGAVDRFYVGADGEVQPCEFLNISFGNVAREPFEEILERMRAVFPEPCCEWLCCTQAEAIGKALAADGSGRTPLPWPRTRELVAEWRRGAPTPIYRRLGIYSDPACKTSREPR